MGVNCGSRQEIDEETNGLKHEGSLRHCELEFLGVVTFRGSPDGDEHQACDEEIEASGEYSKVECPCKSELLSRV